LHAEATEQRAAGVPRRTSRWTLLAILALCAAPVIASYLAYYAFPPEGRVHYGALVEPQIGVADLAVTPLAPTSDAQSFAALAGRWALVTVAPGACPGDCAQRLYAIRQVRLAVGRDAERVERVWLVTDGVAPAAELLAQHPGMHVWFAPPGLAQERFAGSEHGLARIFLVDPHGKLMMRFPAQADPGRIRKDLARLLKISRIG